MTIILDMGSGITCDNQPQQVAKMITAVAEVDSREHEIILKWQLFTEWGDLTPLHPGVFRFAYWYAADRGYSTTASVFDMESLNLLNKFDVPFVKIACIPELYYLKDRALGIGYWEKSVLISVPNPNENNKLVDMRYRNNLCCVREYPAKRATYETTFGGLLHYGISDHTDDFYLLEKYKPKIWERHFALEWQTGLDTGAHAIDQDDLSTALGILCEADNDT